MLIVLAASGSHTILAFTPRLFLRARQNGTRFSARSIGQTAAGTAEHQVLPARTTDTAQMYYASTFLFLVSLTATCAGTICNSERAEVFEAAELAAADLENLL